MRVVEEKSDGYLVRLCTSYTSEETLRGREER